MRRALLMPEPASSFAGWVLLHAWILIAVLVIEAMVGYPAWLHARIPHPVVWAGYAIGALDRHWNKPEYSFAQRRLLGFIAVLLVAGAGFGIGAAVEDGILVGAYAVGGGPTPVYEGNSKINLAAVLVLAFIASAGLAQRSRGGRGGGGRGARRAGGRAGAR